jgi:hypothetical protein
MESMIQAGTVARLAIALFFGCLLLPSGHAQQANQGMWKWVVPPVKMKGSFDDHDPIGLVAGKLIPADCSFNWTDPDTHRLYCFTSATSLVYFLDSPQAYIAQAEKNWRALKSKSVKAP